jgi:hypothetical protein
MARLKILSLETVTMQRLENPAPGADAEMVYTKAM